MHRRNFIRAISGTLLLLSNGSIVRAGGLADKKVVFRFVVASDGHYGEEHTDFNNYYKNVVQSINAFHSSNPLNAVVINGDIIHNIPSFLPDAERELKQLQIPFYVTRGNHDRVSADVWQSTWNMPLNHSVVIQDQVFLLGDTSNEQGKYLTPNMDFFSKHLKEYKSAKNIFIFLHITPVKWTENAVDGTDFQKLILQHNNIRAVFNGHDHDQDNVKMLGKIPFLFDGHFGGSWGTDYQGFRVVELLEDNSIRSFIMNPLVKLNDFYTIQE
ncbi:MAG: metallophosphoesterase [Sphingobacteriales bacterium]|nr:metallophosphoesterase [Sphingobacteriales bacterium]OJY89643.1 MAG: metallophosphoesterase [Sphingobacteriales bacterium 44-15]